MAHSYEEMMKDTIYLPFHLGYLTPPMILKAKIELNEHEDTRSYYVKKLRQLIQKEKNLKCRTDDEFLLQFLRSRKFDIEKAFSCLKKLYSIFEVSYRDVFADHDANITRKVLCSGFASHLPYRDEEGAAVLLVKTSHWDTSKYDPICIFNALSVMVMDAIDDPATQVCGVHLLVDVSGLTFQHVTRLTPRYLNLVSKGMKIHFHKDNESLQKFIPKAILPAEYGGDNFDFDPASWSSTELQKFLPKYLRLINHRDISN